ncbi:ATP-grasp domain-containing protein [Xanthocytophaga flava]|uniref:ATP-grasp domain-containing protein n=1 Tax=Xanthocytophaga flava TaxID=3048013 RepID=UPI0028D2318C|nr:ATP-grasp domain-containing protein [Xanthocytophaga flavus]MDJ1471204.1 ATP-grasp domain-containing protein [Xanthocytophaga flavus]
MIIISESSPQLPPSASANDIRKVTQTAELVGIQSYYIPQSFDNISIEDAFSHIPEMVKEEIAFWIGYVPDPEHYRNVYQELLKKNIRLVNSPEDFQQAEEFDRYYPYIEHMTCKSLVATSVSEAKMMAQKIGYPVFIKGTIQSFKKWGWKSCVAYEESALENIVSNLYKSTSRSLGKVIIREVMQLRHVEKTGTDFPKGREYRVFLLNNQVIDYSYYWDNDDLLRTVSKAEETIILDTATQASVQIGVPYIAVDIGQKESGEWTLIEVGDAQFSGICAISPVKLWQRILQLETVN